jgi:hypothetical protein
MKGYLVFALFLAPGAYAQQSIDHGQVEQVTGYNNRAQQFGSAAEAWKNEYPIEEIRKPPTGNGTAKRIRYCLDGQRRGAELLKSGNQVSVDYEGYMAVPGNMNPGLAAAYQDQERNLHGLSDELKKRREAAKCS